MTDRIIIKDLFLRTIIGINDDERINRQDVLINLTLETDTHLPGISDDIADTVNYRTMTKQVIDLVENSSFFLIEKMCEEIAQVCLQDQRVEHATVCVEKPAALRFSRSVSVCIERDRNDFA